MKYVMSDIHGDYQNFYKMMVKINFSGYDQLYILGDIIDHGYENLCLCDIINRAENVFLIKGKHEYLCERYLEGKIEADVWDTCGGHDTRWEIDDLPLEEKESLYSFLKGLPLYLTVNVKDQEYLLTHSGYHGDWCVKDENTGIVKIEESIKKAIEWNQEEYLCSDDLYYLAPDIQFDKKVIAGHYPTILIPGYYRSEIYHAEQFTGIDTGNDRRREGGRLSCLRLDDGKEFYV